ncbi:hypothetical protein H5203_21580 [Pseudoalteromonas sp. SG41-1]|uniref:hypothetical protein n=1 Tax=Pseudoalteromonas sp. SG41-1 TaxID=2760979 RepID=UPI001602A004|nr:hypothetical protein [Pseudoalteromonas sp. SG41-1]MBB1508037.1 hypothetical protein [Pseudoalteromonas sp. SG41-1]
MKENKIFEEYIDDVIVFINKYYLQSVFYTLVIFIVCGIGYIFLNINVNTDISSTRYRMDVCINVMKNSKATKCKQGILNDTSSTIPTYFIAYKSGDNIQIESNKFISQALRKNIENAYNKQNIVMDADCTNPNFCNGLKLLNSKTKEVFWTITKDEYLQFKDRYDNYYDKTR